MPASSTGLHKNIHSADRLLYPTPTMNIPHYTSKSNEFDHFHSQFQSLTISSHSPNSLTSDSSVSHSSPNSSFTLGAPFSMSYNYQPKEVDDGPTIIDTFSPKPLVYELSPTSSDSSDLDSHYSSPRSSFETFIATRSRVVRLYNLPRLAEAYLSAVFLPQSNLRGPIPAPVSMWTLRDEYCEHRPDSVWAVFRTHEEAAAALSLSNPALSVTTALESDLEPFHKLRRFVLTAPAPSSRPSATTSHPLLRVSSSHSDLQGSRTTYDRTSGMDGGEYTISSNPPNPRTSFRLGDWICSSPKCAAHNFGRNLACIGCGCARSNGSTSAGGSAASTPQSYPATRNLSSPRFASFPQYSNSLPNPSTQPPVLQQQAHNNYTQPQQPHYSQQQQHPQQPTFSQPSPPASKSAHPLLTPSGRAFAVGGKVQNISSDPLSPCIMYWPDNEPFPEQGQIRPSGLVGIPYSQQPPILNTGNRGPISHQPGDWVCQKCNYLNWRRRKVCQTCLPYAEGNGDSISAAVQAERIALLTSVLAQTQQQAASPQAPPQAPRSHSMTPPQHRRPFIDVSPPQAHSQTLPQTHAPVHRSHSHFELGAQYNNSQYNNNRDASPIYQTSGTRQHQPSPLYSTGPDFNSLPVHAPAPLLPSFLQDIVQSPALSPTSTSSADLSFEEYDDSPMIKTAFPRTHNGDDCITDSATDSPLGNIWRLDGEESKSLSAFALPNSQDLIGSGRKNGREGLRLQLITS